MPKVIKSFRDKYTKKIYRKGDSYTHKDEKRIAFLVESGFLEIEEEKKKTTRKKASE